MSATNNVLPLAALHLQYRLGTWLGLRLLSSLKLRQTIYTTANLCDGGITYT